MQLHDVELSVSRVLEKSKRSCGKSARYTTNLHNNDNCRSVSHPQTHFGNDEEAFEVVRRGKAWGALVFQKNYSESLVERTERGQNADDGAVDAADLDVRLDMSSELNSNQFFINSKEFLRSRHSKNTFPFLQTHKLEPFYTETSNTHSSTSSTAFSRLATLIQQLVAFPSSGTSQSTATRFQTSQILLRQAFN